MVDLFTVKRVLALDLGMSERAIIAHLDELGLVVDAGPGPTAVPLADALRIVAVAEARTAG